MEYNYSGPACMCVTAEPAQIAMGREGLAVVGLWEDVM